MNELYKLIIGIPLFLGFMLFIWVYATSSIISSDCENYNLTVCYDNFTFEEYKKQMNDKKELERLGK